MTLTTHEDHGATVADLPMVPLDKRTAATYDGAVFDAAMDTARELADRGDIERGDIETHAHVIAERVRTMADRDPRAVHTWIRAGQPRGDESPPAAAPAHYSRVVADTVQRRSNNGTTYKQVTRHGRAYVAGSTTARADTWHGPTLTGQCSMSAAVLAHAIDTAPRTALGHVDAVALAMLTDTAYPDIPRLIGADVVSYAVGAVFDDGRAVRDTVRHVSADHVGTRYRLRTPRARAGELAMMAAGELIASADDDGAVFIGHRKVPRSTTVRAARAARRRTIDAAFIVPRDAVLADHVAYVADTAPTVPYRATIEHEDHGTAVTLTISGTTARPRLSVSGLAPVAIKARTSRALRRAIDAAS